MPVYREYYTSQYPGRSYEYHLVKEIIHYRYEVWAGAKSL